MSLFVIAIILFLSGCNREEELYFKLNSYNYNLKLGSQVNICEFVDTNILNYEHLCIYELNNQNVVIDGNIIRAVGVGDSQITITLNTTQKTFTKTLKINVFDDEDNSPLNCDYKIKNLDENTKSLYIYVNKNANNYTDFSYELFGSELNNKIIRNIKFGYTIEVVFKTDANFKVNIFDNKNLNNCLSFNM